MSQVEALTTMISDLQAIVGPEAQALLPLFRTALSSLETIENIKSLEVITPADLERAYLASQTCGLMTEGAKRIVTPLT